MKVFSSSETLILCLKSCISPPLQAGWRVVGVKLRDQLRLNLKTSKVKHVGLLHIVMLHQDGRDWTDTQKMCSGFFLIKRLLDTDLVQFHCVTTAFRSHRKLFFKKLRLSLSAEHEKRTSLAAITGISASRSMACEMDKQILAIESQFKAAIRLTMGV